MASHTQLQENALLDYDYELIHDIQSRMILHWNYRNLREIPDEVLNFGEHIEEIYLKRNCLENLPANIGKLCNLTNLYLVGNQLAELPNEIGDLKCLKVLDVSQNYIRHLPSAIGKLIQLESLLLTYNQLEELPKCLKNLGRLKQLEVSGNRIYTVPSEVIEGIESLEEFGIDRNPISYIPRNICLLKNLRYFSACRCNLLLLPSLPFYPLFHNSQRNRNSGRGQSNRNLQFLFDGNPRLNYIPYWVLQLLGSSVECFGCGLDPGESDDVGGHNLFHPRESSAARVETQLQLYTYRSDVNRPKIKLNFKGKRRTLHFDEDIVKLHHHSGFNGNADGDGGATAEKGTVASLLELCLRQIHQLGLLEKADEQCCGVKPVVEPLIVPQRAKNPLINIRENHQKKDCDSFEKIDDTMQDGESAPVASAVPSSSSSSSVLHAPQSSLLQESPDDRNHMKTLSSAEVDGQHDATTENDFSKAKSGSGETSDSVQTDLPIEDKVILPVNLHKILTAGPVAKCFECLKPVFTESWPIIFHIPGWVFDENLRERLRGGGAAGINDIRGDWDDMHNGKLSIGCTHFCSDTCVKRFQTGTKFSSNLVMSDLRCIVENELQWING